MLLLVCTHVFVFGWQVSLTYDLDIAPEDNVVTIKSYFQPLDINTMLIMDKNELPLDGPEVST